MRPPARPPGHKTYTWLAKGRRLPPEYEIVSSDLHDSYPDRFELDDNPVAAWYRRHRDRGCGVGGRAVDAGTIFGSGDDRMSAWPTVGFVTASA